MPNDNQNEIDSCYNELADLEAQYRRLHEQLNEVCAEGARIGQRLSGEDSIPPQLARIERRMSDLRDRIQRL